MLPLAHIGVTIFISSLLYLPLTFAVIGSVLPDVFDKLLVILDLSSCSRFFGHTLLFGAIVSLIVYIFTKRKDSALAILFGCYTHLILDAQQPVPWLYPFISYEFPVTDLKFYFGIFEAVTESMGAVLITITNLFNSDILYYREKIKSKLFSNFR